MQVIDVKQAVSAGVEKQARLRAVFTNAYTAEHEPLSAILSSGEDNAENPAVCVFHKALKVCPSDLIIEIFVDEGTDVLFEHFICEKAGYESAVESAMIKTFTIKTNYYTPAFFTVFVIMYVPETGNTWRYVNSVKSILRFADHSKVLPSAVKFVPVDVVDNFAFFRTYDKSVQTCFVLTDSRVIIIEMYFFIRKLQGDVLIDDHLRSLIGG